MVTFALDVSVTLPLELSELPNPFAAFDDVDDEVVNLLIVCLGFPLCEALRIDTDLLCEIDRVGEILGDGIVAFFSVVVGVTTVFVTLTDILELAVELRCGDLTLKVTCRDKGRSRGL